MRRVWLSTALLLGLAASAVQARPNVVFVLTDDLSWDLVSQMPAVQRLQRDGTTFTRFFVSDSMCCPSRATIFTGRFPHNTGVLTNVGPSGGYDGFFKRENPLRSFAVGLHRAGYRTGFLGKYLNRYTPGANGMDPGWDRWWASSDGYAGYDYDVSDQGRPRFYGRGPGDFMTDALARRGAAFVRGAARRGQPFFVELATYAPHAPYAAPPRYVGSAANLPMPPSAGFDAASVDPPRWLGTRPPLTPTDRLGLLSAWRKRVESVRAVDDLIRRLRGAARAAGVLRDTYFVFSSDNGYHLGQHRLLAGKRTIYESDIRVPLVVAGPGVRRGAVVRRLASTVDLAPTFLAMAGQRARWWHDGRSLLPALRGRPPRNWRRTVFVEHHHPTDSLDDPDFETWAQGTPPTYYGIRGRGWVYAEYRLGEPEFYDLRRDPGELDNLADRLTAVQRWRLHDIVAAYQGCTTGYECRLAARIPPPRGLHAVSRP